MDRRYLWDTQILMFSQCQGIKFQGQGLFQRRIRANELQRDVLRKNIGNTGHHGSFPPIPPIPIPIYLPLPDSFENKFFIRMKLINLLYLNVSRLGSVKTLPK